MSAYRHLSLYALAFASLELALWALVGLGRAIFSGHLFEMSAGYLTAALLVALVAVPVFIISWRLAQRSAAQSAGERYGRSRAVFLYGILFATLALGMQNMLALAAQLLLRLFGLDPAGALIGADQAWTDNLVSVALNGLAAGYFYFAVLRPTWQERPPGEAFAEVRCAYRYLWLGYSLVYLMAGGQQVLVYLFSLPLLEGSHLADTLANGLALLLVGGPTWWYVRGLLQRSQSLETGRQVLVRLAALAGVSFFSLVGLLASGGVLLARALPGLVGMRFGWGQLLAAMAGPLAAILPLGLVWFFYGRAYRKELAAQPGDPACTRLRRLYAYGLALLGLAAGFSGAVLLSGTLLEAVLTPPTNGSALAVQLSGALAALAAGAPLWFYTWRQLQREAAQPGDAGEAARRSPLRSAYLYLWMLAGAAGGVASAVLLLYLLVHTLLGASGYGGLQGDAGLELARQAKNLVLFAALAGYHWFCLRADHKRALQALARRHAQYPLLVLAPDEAFAETMVGALHRQVPALPVAVHLYSHGVPGETLAAARAVILPAELAARPTEALRLWLQGFSGPRIVVPTPVKDWLWVAGGTRSLPALARQAAVMARQLAESGEFTPSPEAGYWQFLVYVLAGLFVLQVALGLVGYLISLVCTRGVFFCG